MPGNGDEDQHDGELDDHDARVEVSRLLDADHQDGGDDDNGEKCHQIEHAGHVRQSRGIDAILFQHEAPW